EVRGRIDLRGADRAVADTRPDRSKTHQWHGPGARETRAQRFEAKRLLWALVFPARRHRISPTVPGLFLMILAMGIGTAAYNTSSNILFITLSLLLACLLLSGLLSWFNFTGVCWRLSPQGPWRVGHEAMVAVEIQNQKRWLPTYSLWAEMATQPKRAPLPEKPDRELKVREILAAADKLVVRGRVFVRERIEPRGETTLEWLVKPTQRGEAFVELAAVGSLFPFGFLKKNIGVALRESVLVWPAQISYQWTGAVATRAGVQQGRRTTRVGRGDDLLALRDYNEGDSHRLIHWKASARLGRLMIRQFAAETNDGYLLRVDPSVEVWTRPEQFELLCGFVGTMAEDLFAAGRLRGLSVDGGPMLETRRVRDLEALLDELARLQPRSALVGGVPAPRNVAPPRGEGTPPTNGKKSHDIITFAPEGARGVAAYVDGHKAATA
ncbi:MAG: DUF58 domain-containing protein, partial [Lacunisphaera sp.]